MSMSLRDQLLQAGLISKKQADEADRQSQRRERRPVGKPGTAPADRRAAAPGTAPSRSPAPRPPAPRPAAPRPAAPRPEAPRAEPSAKAERRAQAALTKQMIAQHRLPPVEGGEPYHFVEGGAIRRIAVTPALRARLIAAELSIARHGGEYQLIPTELAAKLRERGVPVITPPADGAPRAESDEAYAAFPVPDDLMW
ncbi:MAG: DUF2058 domain-containing protein [Gammaproteobacteria bacterium]|nr:DUF2058 domain-containing protein [Gammaproteobacteria bacterium]